MKNDSRPSSERKTLKNGILRLLFTVMAIALEIFFIVEVFYRLNSRSAVLSLITKLGAVVLILIIYSMPRTSALKMSWMLMILVFPVFGIIMYLLTGFNGGSRKMAQRYALVDKELFTFLRQDESVQAELEKKDSQLATVSSYTYRYSHYPVYRNTAVKYFPAAELSLEDMKKNIRKARKFIFLEYFAIEDNEAFREVKELLAEKAAQGLDVRILYDDVGSIGFVSNKDFITRMTALNIKCRVFNPMRPALNLFLNNRDHRKITVIDGVTGYTGGFNLADKYMNITHPFGHWKDTGIRVEGEGVKSMTVMFLEMWNAVRDNDVDDQSFDEFLRVGEKKEEEKLVAYGNWALKSSYRSGQTDACFVQPYADTPMDNENVGESIYMSLVEKAEKYIYFMTPYLILSDELASALALAARRGVDVRIITPGIPDKKMIYQITRSFYHPLTVSGVKIYEYTPGFCHGKMCVSDDRVCTCGTINLDFRSLYFHFEDGCLIYGGKTVMDVKQDFLETFEVSRDVTEKYKDGRGRLLKLGQLVLRLFAGLL